MEEILLAELPEIGECAVVAARRDGQPVAVAVVRPEPGTTTLDPASLLDRVNKALRQAGQPPVALLEIARTEADLPVGYTGKVLKRQLREKYAAPEGWDGTDRLLAVAA
jgi:acyl-coenzyme A synthetase/AMP-(fatty) acid ligase